MRGFLLALVLAAAPMTAHAAEGDGKCFWSRIPPVDQDQAIIAYGREGHKGLTLSLVKIADETHRANAAACGHVLGEKEGDFDAYMGALIGYGLEQAALDSLAERTGQPRSTFEGIWPALTAQQRQAFRTENPPEPATKAALEGLYKAAETAGLSGEKDFDDVFMIVVGRGMRERSEAKP